MLNALVAAMVFAGALNPPVVTPDPDAFIFNPPLPVTIRIKASSRSRTVYHRPQGLTDEFCVNVPEPLNDDETGLQVEFLDSGRRIWLEDYSRFDLSARPGCTVSISRHRTLNAVILHFQGYRHDAESQLYFISTEQGTPRVIPYRNGKADILRFVQKSPRYPRDFTYVVKPAGFDAAGVLMMCTPLANRGESHPYSNFAPWFSVTATVDGSGKLTPQSVKRFGGANEDADDDDVSAGPPIQYDPSEFQLPYGAFEAKSVSLDR